MQEAIKLSFEMMRKNKGGPFGAVVTKGGKLISKGWNQVTSSNDPTAHGEVVAIRRACKKLKTFDLSGCEIYTSCEPCPMCLTAIYWARIDRIYYGNTQRDAAKIGFDDKYFYDEVKKPLKKRDIPITQILHKEALDAFKEWDEKEDKILY